MRAHLPALAELVEGVRRDGIRDVVLCGMGGSSLAAEVFATVFGAAEGHPDLHVLDSTHPEVVGAVDDAVDYATTLFLIASKSGGTIETVCFRDHFEMRLRDAGIAGIGRHFVAITDPQTALGEHARRWDYRATFENPPDVGGRYSALTLFGLVPAALLGVDVGRLLDAAAAEAELSRSAETPCPALALGAALGALAGEGVDKLELHCSPRLAPLGAWVEQLVAESTGKEGRGILPVLVGPDEAGGGSDRFALHVTLSGDGPDPDVAAPGAAFRIADVHEIGALFYRFELATAVAAAVLGVNPFDEPDVRAAKEATAAVLEGAEGPGLEPVDGDSFELRVADVVRGAHEDVDAGDAAGWLRAHVGGARPGEYVAVLSYLAGSPETDDLLQELRAACAATAGTAATLGTGPRYLHSTGQLHKGGPDRGVFLVLAPTPPAGEDDVAIPMRTYSFGALLAAQAEGDFRALEARGRRVAAVTLRSPAAAALRALVAALRNVS